MSLAHFAHSAKKKKGIFEKFLCTSAALQVALGRVAQGMSTLAMVDPTFKPQEYGLGSFM